MSVENNSIFHVSQQQEDENVRRTVENEIGHGITSGDYFSDGWRRALEYRDKQNEKDLRIMDGYMEGTEEYIDAHNRLRDRHGLLQ